MKLHQLHESFPTGQLKLIANNLESALTYLSVDDKEKAERLIRGSVEDLRGLSKWVGESTLTETTNQAMAFVMNIPSTEEEMLDICREIVSRDKSVSHFKQNMEYLEQLLGVMEDYLERNKKK